jgi:alkylation response protein AidB-like acyl-CoA dehydrogenase
VFSLKEASSVAREPEVAAAVNAVDRYLLAASGPQQFRQAQDAKAFEGLVKLGLTNALAPERSGGSGFAPGVAVLIGERLGWFLAREPFIENVVLPATLLQALRAPAPADREILCVAWQEGPFHMPTAGSIRAKVTAEGAGLRLRGTKRFVMGAGASTRLLVLASMDGAPAILSVPSSKTIRKDKRLADGSSWSEIEFDTLVEPSAVLGRGEAALRALAHAIDLANLSIAGVLHGLQSRILAMTLEYLGTREQFGKPLGSFQALQHRAVDLYTLAQIARFLLGEAVDAARQGVPAATLAAYASRAKARTADSAARIAKEGLQMHGAIGFSDEYDLGLYVKRVLVLSAWLGGAAWHRRRFAMLEPATAGA